MIRYDELNKLLLKIKSMPYSLQKIITLISYQNLCQYFEYISDYTYEELTEELHNIIMNDDILYSRLISIYDKAKIKGLNSVLESDLLNPYLKSLVDEVNPYNVYFDYFPRVNDNKMFNNLEDFCGYLGDDVYKYYKKLKEKDYIIGLNSNFNASGLTFIMPNDYSPIIYLNTNDYWKYYTIAHELGHSYFATLTSKFNIIDFTNAYEEIPSTLFEYLFIEFLKNNRLLDEKTLKTIDRISKVTFIEYIKTSLICNDLIKDRNEIMDFDEIYDEEEKIEELSESFIPNIHVKKSDVYYRKNLYAIGGIVSSYYVELFNQDNKLAMKDFKSFIMLAKNRTLDDILEEVTLEPAKKRIRSI